VHRCFSAWFSVRGRWCVETLNLSTLCTRSDLLAFSSYKSHACYGIIILLWPACRMPLSHARLSATGVLQLASLLHRIFSTEHPCIRPRIGALSKPIAISTPEIMRRVFVFCGVANPRAMPVSIISSETFILITVGFKCFCPPYTVRCSASHPIHKSRNHMSRRALGRTEMLDNRPGRSIRDKTLHHS
jgi:hypothetical protein